MSIYSYTQAGPIDEVTFRRTENGAIRAYLHAREGTDASALSGIVAELKKQDMECIPFTFEGKPAMEVRGFKREAELLTMMDKQQWIQGKASVVKEKADIFTWKDIIQKRSIQASGVAMMIADIGFAMYGAKEKSTEDTLAGLSYLSGSATLLAYGRNDQSNLQIREMAEIILKDAKARGFKVDDDSAVADIGKTRHDSTLRKVNNFFQQHPSEIGNMGYVAAGALIAKSALQHRALAKPRADMTPRQIAEMRKGGWGDTALGVSTVASGLLATLVKEKHIDPDAPKSHGMKAVVDWIREKPLRLASYGYMASTLCHAYTTYSERKEAMAVVGDLAMPEAERIIAGKKLKAIPWRVLFIGATLVGEVLLSISSKGHGEGVVSDNTVDNSVISIASELIARQPAHRRNDLITYMSHYLGGADMLAMKDDEVAKLLRAQVEAMCNNPWVPSEKGATKTEPAAKPAAAKSDVPAWQAKLTADKSATPPQISA